MSSDEDEDWLNEEDEVFDDEETNKWLKEIEEEDEK